MRPLVILALVMLYAFGCRALVEAVDLPEADGLRSVGAVVCAERAEVRSRSEACS